MLDYDKVEYIATGQFVLVNPADDTVRLSKKLRGPDHRLHPSNVRER